MTKPDIVRLSRLGIIPSLDRTPLRYDKKEIDVWVASGKLELHRPAEYHHPRGVWL